VTALVDSPSFAQTHAGIRALAHYPEFTRDQIRALIQAANRNDQIYEISNDTDVYEFFSNLADRYSTFIDTDDIGEFWDTFGVSGS
jgi:hypothetical protein